MELLERAELLLAKAKDDEYYGKHFQKEFEYGTTRIYRILK